MGLKKIFEPSHTGIYHIKQHDPVRKYMIQAVVFAIVVLLGWFLFQLGFRLSGFEELAAENSIQELQERVAFLEAENQRLSDEASYQGRSSEIEHHALDEVRTELEKREEELLSLKEELAFYRSIVSPSAMRPGLHIQSLQLENAEAKGEYRYKLVLTLVRGKRVAKGRVTIEIKGLHNGKPENISVAGDDAGLKFSFRYFQRIEGKLVLPEGFKPEQVSVSVHPSSQKMEPVDKVFDWKVISELGVS
jgi:hypothetical protein